MLKSITLRIALLAAVFFIAMGAAAAAGEEKIQLGALENVVLLPWGVQLPARIDTGAATSSLDARNLEVFNNYAHFQLPLQYGGLRLRLPIVRWATIRSADSRTRRPFVELELCIGAKRVRTQVNLIDRSGVEYPLLLGRNTLAQGFIIDCNTTFCTIPSCLEASSP